MAHDKNTTTGAEHAALERERGELLQQVATWLEPAMIGLGLVWLGLLIWELINGLTPALETAGLVIWVIFIADFLLELWLAPRKLDYLGNNWLTAVSLVVPALRVLRVARVLRAARGLRLFRVVSSLNRGMKALGASFGRRGFGYVVAQTTIMTLGGAAGMYAFENDVEGGFSSYSEALWWTAMIMTTMGSQYWPQSPEARVLCVVLALYAFGIFGYVTAALATFFVGRDAESQESELPSASAVEELTQEVRRLREEITTSRPPASTAR
jgi:voltage-gated potassium channel